MSDVTELLTDRLSKCRTIAGTPLVLLRAIVSETLEAIAELEFMRDDDAWKVLTIEQLVDPEDEWQLCMDGNLWPASLCVSNGEGDLLSPLDVRAAESRSGKGADPDHCVLCSDNMVSNGGLHGVGHCIPARRSTTVISSRSTTRSPTPTDQIEIVTEVLRQVVYSKPEKEVRAEIHNAIEALIRARGLIRQSGAERLLEEVKSDG